MAIGARSGGTVNTSLITTGAVGIGDATPAVQLHVQGAGGAVSPSSYSVIDLAIENSGEAALGIIGTTYSSIYFGDAGSPTIGGIVYNHSNNSTVFSTSATTALTLDSSQNATFAGDMQAAGVYVGSTNTSYDFYNNGTSYLNGAVTVDANLTMTGSSNVLSIAATTNVITIPSLADNGTFLNITQTGNETWLFKCESIGGGTVSYTHLTLPTILRV